MKLSVLLVFFVCQFTFSHSPYWAKTGHRVVGEVAQEHLTNKTKRALKDLLDGQSLAAVANFADEIKSDSTYRKFSAWHYVNFPADEKYGDSPVSPYGDIVMGIRECIRIVKDPNSSPNEKSFYLKMLIHLVGDLHQPMHVGRLEDKGGNDIQLQWFNNGSNLHRVWDSHMIDDYGMSYSELTSKFPALSNKEIKKVQQGTVLDWVEESQEIANEVYASVSVGEKLYYRYSYVWWGTVETQLQKGGLRLAKVLNDLFK
ncbi:S1/P1 nuclease [Muriicola sp. Z0-33]|uniref:S1/P1 nuclease n=1 Tax=Muriicola sp. Z0-33 TaxID=2816957 RepID=UPI002236F53F|nr:S1/P1 nuclease [Muriicola sp. Z0-33]MCW5517399.1 S1/P1 nuclease [Muriicola sp. Z0-33]